MEKCKAIEATSKKQYCTPDVSVPEISPNNGIYCMKYNNIRNKNIYFNGRKSCYNTTANMAIKDQLKKALNKIH